MKPVALHKSNQSMSSYSEDRSRVCLQEVTKGRMSALCNVKFRIRPEPWEGSLVGSHRCLSALEKNVCCVVITGQTPNASWDSLISPTIASPSAYLLCGKAFEFPSLYQTTPKSWPSNPDIPVPQTVS